MAYYRSGHSRRAHTRVVNGKVQHVRSHYVSGHMVNKSASGRKHSRAYRHHSTHASPWTYDTHGSGVPSSPDYSGMNASAGSTTTRPSSGCLFGMAFATILGVSLILFNIYAIPTGIIIALPMYMAMSAVYGNPIGVGWIACALLVALSMFILRDFIVDMPAFLLPASLSCLVVVVDALLRRHYRNQRDNLPDVDASEVMDYQSDS